MSAVIGKRARTPKTLSMPFLTETTSSAPTARTMNVSVQRFCRVLAHGFSAQSMLAQQPVIKQYVDQLFRRLHEASEGGTKPVDIERWFNFTTFDVIGDLAFGEPFGCLEDGTYHP
ncbi:cytochrome P450 [Diaporthe eres]|nr:cytochrome P450 [Diaporthe eres]